MSLIGRKIGGRYEIRRLLGEGGMAEVYEAHHPKLDRRVAIKLMHRHLSKDEQFEVRFQREAQAIARLKHPHIVQVYDFDVDDDLRQYYMVIEYIDGPTLGDYLKQQATPLPLREALRIIEDLTDALGYAHANQMIHRDIKPGNIMLDKGNRTVLTDFGIAKLMQEGGDQITASGAMVGTPAYMSPEHARGESGDHRADLYSLGVVFFQLVTGQLPYQGDTPISTILMHIKNAPPDPASLNPTLPAGVTSIILRCLAKNPDDRYQNAEGILRHLRNLDSAASELEKSRILSSKTWDNTPVSHTPTADKLTDTLANTPRRTSLLIGIGAVAIIVLLALGAVLFSTAETNGNTDENCLIALEENMRVFTAPESTQEVQFPLGEVELVERQGDYVKIENDDEQGWLTADSVEIPIECNLD